MDNLRGKVAVVTGGASGIGAGLVAAFAEAGMRVVVADIEESRAEQVARQASRGGGRAIAVRVDVADYASVERLANRCYDEFGAAHVLCNNAGVLLMGPLAEMIVEDWNWTMAVNLLGVAHGLQAFVPRMRAQQEPCHIVNTSSVAGLSGSSELFIYCATKAAVLSISEALREELETTKIGVSVLLPGDIRSEIVASQRNRPEWAGRHHTQSVAPEVAAKHGLEPIHVGRRVREGIERGEFYLFTVPESRTASLRERIQKRTQAMLEALPRGGIAGEV